MNPKLLAMAALMLAPHAVASSTTPVKQPPAPSQKPAEIVKQLTPEDYYVPLDNWLKRQGSPLAGRDFYETAAARHLDPDLLIAITQAETNLGKVQQRGSACNVGSVGSYDSTNTTYQCRSQRHGIEMIADTLNNRMLGGYTEIWQLSRAHNPSGSVYAESSANWERNVLNTLGQIKGHPVDIYYNFRR